MFTPGEHERTFPIKPVGVKYICEHCGVGEMEVIRDSFALTSMPMLVEHQCNRCGCKLHLPKSYPYIEWIPDEGEQMSDDKGV